MVAVPVLAFAGMLVLARRRAAGRPAAEPEPEPQGQAQPQASAEP